MPEQLSDESQVAFHEGFTCFSEEEWQLLQDWRNTFHKNMMQEIDHAMMLLGPLIANMVSSSRAKITQEFCITDNQDSGDRPEYEVVSVRIKNEDDTSFLVPENSVRLSVSTTMDSSVCIKEEGVTCPVDVQGYSSGESFNSDDNRNKNGKLESLVKCNRISRLCKSTVKQFKANRREETALWQSDCFESSYSTLHQPPYVQEVEASNICEARTESEKSAPCNLNSQQNNRPYYCPQSEKIRPNSIGRPPRAHQRTARFTCKECGKSFTTISYLRKHERFHTGERPHRCTTCGKTFSLLGGLQRHQKLHTGEKPYQCNICGEYFSRTDVLSRHQKTHIKAKQKFGLSILEIA
ncbi:zinc finger protein 670-like isoform X2 [Pleurodeles waltl]|uniref:zinc finger protein 670-like isoform X2 n=1 Tax=Pleurodeles waltl TaxID=8319 RepID=UPI0037096D96